MNYGSFYAFITSIGFKVNVLTVRFLQEKGVSIRDTYTIYRYALIPAIIWSLIFIRKPDLSLIFQTPGLLIIFGTIVIFWNLQAYLRAQITNGTNSMVLLSTIYNILALPLFFGFGVLFNHDTPNLLNVSAIIVLLVALVIRPTPHKENIRPDLSKPLYAMVLLVLLTACCDTILQGVAREALKQLRPVVFLGAFSVPTLVVCWVISVFYTRRQTHEAEAMRQKQWLAFSLIPMTWFAASIPEAFSLAAIPIYVFISINATTFLMDTVSDVVHRRIHLSSKTVSFIFLVIIGISLSVISV
jgi:hypothetical protein